MGVSDFELLADLGLRAYEVYGFWVEGAWDSEFRAGNVVLKRCKSSACIVKHGSTYDQVNCGGGEGPTIVDWAQVELGTTGFKAGPVASRGLRVTLWGSDANVCKRSHATT